MDKWTEKLSKVTLDDWKAACGQAEEYNVPIRPTQQVPMRAVKNKPHHRRWITCTFADERYHLAAYEIDLAGELALIDSTAGKGYKTLWDAFACLQLQRGTWWAIAFRMRYAIEKAEMLTALKNGLMKLPGRTRKDKPTKRTGKLTRSKSCIEIDLICGRNKIKLLDFEQLGIMPGTYVQSANDMSPPTIHDALKDYLQLCSETGMQANRVTAAQVGYANFRVNHAPAILNVNMNNDQRILERQAYYGGRNEAFRLGQIPGKTHSLDVNSCYGNICETGTMPTRLKAIYPKGLDVDQIANAGEDHWIAEAIIETSQADYPLDYKGQLLFPTGTFRTYLAWPELHHAIGKGRVIKVLKAHRYSADKVLERYAVWYRSIRQRYQMHRFKKIMSVIKATFNASLGYTARQKYELVPWDTDIGYQWWMGITSAPDHSSAVVNAQVIDGTKEWLKIGGEPREAMPFLHATICSYARIQLVDIMNRAGRNNVYYCDTDGILLTTEGLCNLGDHKGYLGASPGQLSTRFPAGRAYINGQKNYKLGDNVVCAGLVHTRHSLWAEKEVLTTPTGCTDCQGIVTPFNFHCDDLGDVEARYVNEPT